jgi:hypothetical protein
LIQLNAEQFDRWIAAQAWLSLPDPNSWRFKIAPSADLRRYECEIAEDSSIVGCNMSRCFLHDLEPGFSGGLFWIVRRPHDEDVDLFVAQVLRGFGVELDSARPWFVLDKAEYERCFTLISLALMFGWDANFVAEGRRYLLQMDDEPFPSLVTDSITPWFAEVVKNLEFKVSEMQ